MGEQGGHSLPPPTPHSPASHTFMAPSLPTPALHGITPVFMSIKQIRNLEFWQALPWLGACD